MKRFEATSFVSLPVCFAPMKISWGVISGGKKNFEYIEGSKKITKSSKSLDHDLV
jgi:hypothetical protein